MPYDFAKLTADVKAALEVGTDAASVVDDGGACNFDGVFLRIPHIKEARVVKALQLAGLNTHKSDWIGPGYMINSTSDGQANKRMVASEATYKHLNAAGYEVTPFYMMD